MKFSGEEAIAQGAIDAGVYLATGYPGSPGTGIMEFLIKHQPQIEAEWSVNEKVAIETAHGATIGGARALVCVKNVGLNAMVDPIMAMNLSPLSGGLVVVVGDDPGAYGSQNDQDSRPLAHLFELPWFEPFHPEQAYTLTKRSFAWSERFGMPIFLRITRSFSQMREVFETSRNDVTPSAHTLQLDNNDRYIPQPSNAVKKHSELQDRLGSFAEYVSKESIQQIHESVNTLRCGGFRTLFSKVGRGSR